MRPRSGRGRGQRDGLITTVVISPTPRNLALDDTENKSGYVPSVPAFPLRATNSAVAADKRRVYSCRMATTDLSIQSAEYSLRNPAAGSPGRLLCLDIYRGLMVAAMIIVDNPGSDEHAYWPIMHAKWNGWTPADFIFPSFLFLVGISLVYSTAARRQRAQSNLQILGHAFKRSLILIAIGLLVNASPLYGLDLHTWRFEGVTQRIAICYLFALMLELWAGRRGQVLAFAGCLIGYWALVRFVPVPGAGLPVRDIPFLDQVQNLPAWLDRKLFAGHLYDGHERPGGNSSYDSCYRNDTHRSRDRALA